MTPTAVGVAGVGSLGFHHARLLGDIPEARLAGIYDIDDHRARSVADQLATSAYPSLESLLEDVEALSIVVPTHDHLAVGRAALERGRHILIEKPIAHDLDEADELIRLAREYGCLVQVGHIERFNGAVRACEPYLDNPLFVESHRLAPFVRRGTDVPVVLDLMIHDIDLVVSLLGDAVTELRAVGVSVLSPSVDIANARLEFEGGAVANITASRVSLRPQRKIRFFQPTGYISLDLGAGSGEFYRRKTPGGDVSNELTMSNIVEHISLRGDGTEPLRLELESFLRAIRGEATVPVTAEEGRQALALALDIVDHIDRHRAHVLDSYSTREEGTR